MARNLHGHKLNVNGGVQVRFAAPPELRPKRAAGSIVILD
jgi:hypothetical protein